MPLQLLAGLHFLVLRGEAGWDSVDDALERHADFLRSWLVEQPVQTNEPQRSWVLLPLFLHAAGGEEVHVLELGASAGLNLVFDRYRYRFERGGWGPTEAPLELAGEERRPVPAELLARPLRVATRLGLDRSPIDATTEEGATLLRSFVWAGQDERMARLERAIGALRADPPELITGDVVEVLAAALARLPADGLALVFQTSLFEYLTPEARDGVRELLDRADRELVFVASGKPRGVPRSWGMRIHRPGREREFIGHADYHGAWLDYQL